MNVLILSNPEYEDFVVDVARPFWNDHTIFIWTERDRFIFGCEDMKFPYDVGISFMCQYKVPAEEVNTHTWINFHPAPLPKYKGRDLCYHAIMNGEKEFGATVHYMDENFDTGDIIDVRKFPVYDYYTAEDVSRMAVSVSESLFMTYLPRILETPVFPRTPNVGGKYYPKGSIVEEIPLHDVPLARWIRAVTYKNFYPRIDIGGVKYKIVRDE